MGLVAFLVGLAALAGWLLLATKKTGTHTTEASPLEYEQAISLDAEDLAEGGVRTAYETLLPILSMHAPQPLTLEERLDADSGVYAVTAGGREYVISGPGLDDEGGWGRATVALFSIVNRQLEHSALRLYALNGGNDLFAIFLTPSEVEAAQRALSNKRDWPYLPKENRRGSDSFIERQRDAAVRAICSACAARSLG